MKRALFVLSALWFLCVAQPALAQSNPIAESSDQEWHQTTFGATLIGTVVGGAIGLVTLWLNSQIQRRDQKLAAQEFEANLLAAIKCELLALKFVFDTGVGIYTAAAKAGDVLVCRLALTQNFFTVFEQNAEHLGRLSPKVTQQIIAVYILMKALIEELRINNTYLDRWEELLRNRPEDHMVNAPYQKAAEDIYALLLEKCKRIKDLEALARAQTEKLMPMLEAYQSPKPSLWCRIIRFLTEPME